MSCPIGVHTQLNAQLLMELLKGELSWRQALRQAPPATRTDGATPVDTVIGFAPHPELPSEIFLTTVPLRGSMIPAASLEYRAGGWVASPQILKVDRLLEYQAVKIEQHDWIVALAVLAADLRVTDDWQRMDFTPWIIAAAWPDWEQKKMTWAQRTRDLADRVGVNALSPNSLLVKCRRLGLVRVTR